MSDHSYPLVDQCPVFQLYDARDGLVSHTTHLLQDRLGYLWVGTWTGLYLFDGITFELVYANADTTDNYITCLYRDSRDRIWFGSGGPHGAGNGVVCHENGRFTTYTAKDGLACDYILDICEDSAGCLWFGTNNGATSYDGEQFTTYREGEGLTGQNIHLVHRDVHDRMWFSTGQEVFYLNEDDGDVPGNLSFTRWGENWQWDGFTYKDRRDRIWVLHHTGVTCIDGDKHTHLTAADGLIWNNQFIRNRIAEDAQGNLWFLAHGAGISKFDDKRLFSFTVEGRKIGLGMAMLADIDGNIWTNDAGLLRMEPNTVVMIDEGAVLTAFIEDSHSRFWHTNSDSNLLCFVLPSLAKTSKSKVVAYENDHTVPMCMLETSDGHVWVGGGNFLPYKMMRYRSIDVLYSKGIVQSEEISESGDVKDFSDALPYEYYNIYTMIEARDGTIWMGACISPWDDQGALIRCNGDVFEVISVPQTHITCLFEDHGGDVWAGGYKGGGLSCYDGKTLRTYTCDDGLADDIVRGIHEDNNHALWVLSLQTIYRFDGESFVSFSAEQNLPAFMFQASAKDKQGRLWFGSSTGGIICTDGRYVQQITAEDGLPSNGINGIYPQADRTVTVLTGNGIITYDPQLTRPPSVEILQITADKVYDGCEHLTLTTSETDLFTISYIGRSFSTRRMRYSFMLEGYEESWNHTWNREVRYENLPIGDYTFKVVAINRDLTPSEMPAVLRLTVQPDPREGRIAELESDRERLQAENIYLQREIKLDHNFDEIISHSKVLRRVLQRVEQVAVTDSTVLILGETGTGKELLARAVHSTSKRNHRPLVKVDCANLPENLIESELFGHEKGAFTGAISRKIGRFELADQGTVFLDEIGELPLQLQSKLLRILQEGTFERLGGTRTLQVDARVIAATSRDLEEAMAAGLFREDLFYRLHVFPLDLPPLRSRKEDITMLVQHFVVKYGARTGKSIDRVPQTVMDRLTDYDWPGNVRELEHVIERAVIMSTGHALVSGDWIPVKTGIQNATGLISMEKMERKHILEVLETTRWRIRGPRGAATVLDMKPTTLESRISKLGLKRPTN